MSKLAVAVVFALVLALAAVASVRGQAPDVQISQLDCNSDPEIVVIENEGDEAQQLDGWQLVSDPTDSETFDLSVVGGLQPGASVTIQSGPSASGVFVWSTEFVFRDDDATDFARLVDDGGNTVSEVACAEAAEPTPTATATTEPTPSNVPNGGGLPPAAGAPLPPALLMLVGGSVAALGLMTLAAPVRLGAWLSGRRQRPGEAAAEAGGRPRRAGGSRVFALALLALVAAILVFVLWQRSD